jgi:hypothetical protein
VSLALPSLLDDRSAPTLREGMGLLMMRAARSDFAVQHVRLAALDLGAEELAHGRCRLLLGRFDADVLADFSADDVARRRLAVLAAFLDSGRLAVRAAGLLRWYPDFSIHHRIAVRHRGQWHSWARTSSRAPRQARARPSAAC